MDLRVFAHPQPSVQAEKAYKNFLNKKLLLALVSEANVERFANGKLMLYTS